MELERWWDMFASDMNRRRIVIGRTEAEANEKVCPLLMMVAGYGKCWASRCMMWNWVMAEGAKADGAREDRRGFCGLAGIGPG